jgi:hypothetical protein
VNQRVIFFVALVCIAQLGVTLARNFWSEHSRQVQHVSLSRSSNLKNVLSTSVSSPPSDRSSPPGNGSVTKKPKTSMPKSAPEKSSELSTLIPDSSSSKNVVHEVPREQSHATIPATTKALLPSDSPATDSSREVVQRPVEAAARDPFVPFFQIRKNGGTDDDRPLTEYEVSELKVTAIISDSYGERMASVETPSGRDFIVKAGARIGSRGGRITAILPSKLVIEEPANHAGSTATATDRELALKPPTPLQALVATN